MTAKHLPNSYKYFSFTQAKQSVLTLNKIIRPEEAKKDYINYEFDQVEMEEIDCAYMSIYALCFLTSVFMS